MIASLILMEADLRAFYPQKTLAEIKELALKCFETSEVIPFACKPNCAGSEAVAEFARMRL